jgi:hypothetical protein
MENTTQDKNVLVIEWHVKDNWYGQNYRMVLSKSETEEFKNAKEAKPYRSLLAKFINDKFKLKVTAKRSNFGKLLSFKTYIYCGAGPSYSCNNIHITVAELEAWKVATESTPEYRQKRVEAGYKKENRLRREAIKKAKRERNKQSNIAA